MRIYLLRHGMTRDNVKKKYLGLTDTLLSDEGKAALKLINYEFKYDYVISSPLKRCLETVDILFAKKPLINDSFREFNFGIFEGLTYDNLKNRAEYQSWLQDMTNYVIPNGECQATFKSMVLSEFTQVLNNQKYLDKTIVIVTHGGVIRTIVEKYFLIPFFEISIPYGMGYKIILDNVVKHLEEI